MELIFMLNVIFLTAIKSNHMERHMPIKVPMILLKLNLYDLLHKKNRSF